MELIPLKDEHGRNDPRVQVYSDFFLSYPGALSAVISKKFIPKSKV